MDRSEQILKLSLKQDLQRLNQIIKEISENNNKPVEINSWLFPTKKYTFVEEFMIKKNILKHGSEKLFLELIIDRVYIGIKLLLIQVQDLSLGRLVFTPNQATLGYLFKSLHNAIFQMKETKMSVVSVTEERIEKRKISRKNQESQTDVSSLNRCDSCASAIMCMKNLLNLFDGNDLEHLIKGRRFKPQILDITQFGCMLQTSTVLVDNFKHLTEKIHRREQEIDILRKENGSHLTENMKMKRKIVHVEEEVRVYKAEYEKCTSKVSLLSIENNELNQNQVQNEMRIKTLEHSTENLNKTLTKRNQIIQSLCSEKITLMRNLQWYKENIQKLLKSINSLKKNVEKRYANTEIVERSFVQMEENLDSLNLKLSTISKLNEVAELRVKEAYNVEKKYSNEICENVSKVNERLKIKLSELNGKNAENYLNGFQIRGNPVEDISQQIQENEAKIEALQMENEKLRRILSKFQGFRNV